MNDNSFDTKLKIEGNIKRRGYKSVILILRKGGGFVNIKYRVLMRL